MREPRKEAVRLAGIEVRPLTGHIGAEIVGADLQSPAGRAVRAIRSALVEHQVVFFRDAGLDDEAHMALAARFGKPSVFPMMAALGATEPSLQVIVDGPDAAPAADYWHTDVTWTAEPPDFAFLRAVRVPERGGDTLWGSMTAAYDALSPAMQRFLDPLEADHDNESFIAGTFERLGAEKVAELGLDVKLREQYPPVVHPVVRVHPETGRKALMMGGNFMRRIVGLTPLESETLLAFLRQHIDQPHLHCRWRWTPGDVAIWDERSTVHRALGDHFPAAREVRRCVVDGERPRGVAAA